jgi:uncharacterized protein YdaU (DUF1376 family)
MKDPAFLFYPNDYIGGTMGMTFEEKGAYIELLMMQFNRGHMTEHMIGQTVGQLWVKLKDKFKIDEDGLYYNVRLEQEQLKRKKYTESRRNNKSGKNQYSKKGKKEVKKRGHMTGHMENRNENEDINKDEGILEFSNIEQETWNKWIIYKEEQFKFKYKSVTSEQIALNQLVNISNNSNELAIKIINQSISNGWKGIFELKSNGKDEWKPPKLKKV